MRPALTDRPRQLIMERIGKWGCYFLSIIYLAERITGTRIDAVVAYEQCVGEGWLGPDCFVTRPDKIIGYLTGKEWRVRHEARAYRPTDDELVIFRYERATTMQNLAHFVVGSQSGEIVYDPYGESQTVQHGRLASMRIFSEVKP